MDTELDPFYFWRPVILNQNILIVSKMKNILLILLFCLTSAYSFAQEKEAKKNYKKGNHYFDAKDYLNAVKYYTSSINQFHTANAYLKRAKSYLELSDSCNYCRDIHMAHLFGDTEAGKLYNKSCIMNDTIRSAPDSIRKEYPGYSYTLISQEKCSGEKTTGYYNTNHENIQSIYVKMPEYRGGDEARMLLLRNVLSYPPHARNKGIQGTVYISFIIEANGTISHVKILKGISEELDEEAIRVANMMPPWIPGRQKGKAIRVQFNMPIRFTLN